MLARVAHDRQLRTPRDDHGGTQEGGRPGPDRAPEHEQLPDRGRKLVCARCGHAITSSAARISVNGATEHTFVNPHGLVFDITCYCEAPGCASVGAPSTDWSWFAGHSWQIQICARCATHLGWRFSGERQFWGLIADNLREVDDGA